MGSASLPPSGQLQGSQVYKMRGRAAQLGEWGRGEERDDKATSSETEASPGPQTGLTPPCKVLAQAQWL